MHVDDRFRANHAAYGKIAFCGDTTNALVIEYGERHFERAEDVLPRRGRPTVREKIRGRSVSWVIQTHRFAPDEFLQRKRWVLAVPRRASVHQIAYACRVLLLARDIGHSNDKQAGGKRGAGGFGKVRVALTAERD